jgi:hypothetical protein
MSDGGGILRQENALMAVNGMWAIVEQSTGNYQFYMFPHHFLWSSQQIDCFVIKQSNKGETWFASICFLGSSSFHHRQD